MIAMDLILWSHSVVYWAEQDGLYGDKLQVADVKINRAQKTALITYSNTTASEEQVSLTKLQATTNFSRFWKWAQYRRGSINNAEAKWRLLLRSFAPCNHIVFEPKFTRCMIV